MRIRKPVPPCMLCKHAKEIDTGYMVATYCKIQKDIICDRQWINTLTCWTACPCSPLSENPCPYFEPEDKEEYEHELELAKKHLKDCQCSARRKTEKKPVPKKRSSTKKTIGEDKP